jgi:hypothetical protein
MRDVLAFNPGPLYMIWVGRQRVSRIIAVMEDLARCPMTSPEADMLASNVVR